MKTLFIQAKAVGRVVIPDKFIDKLPKNIGLVGTSQHVHQLDEVRQRLGKKGKKVELLKGKHSKNVGQVLGCDSLNLDVSNVDAVLFIGTGMFHPKGLLFGKDKPLFAYDPAAKQFREIKKSETESIERRRLAGFKKFLASENIGVLITTKPGQSRFLKALELKKLYPGKKFFFLASNSIEFGELENFPFIECFVNTACPRIGLDDASKLPRPVVNLQDILEKGWEW